MYMTKPLRSPPWRLAEIPLEYFLSGNWAFSRTTKSVSWPPIGSESSS